jgi:cytochrome c
MQNQPNRGVAAFTAIAALAVGLGAGYAIWGWPNNWYVRDVAKLPPGAEGDLIRYGHALIVDTASHIGKDAANPEMRLAGNNLACVNCHLDAWAEAVCRALRLHLRHLSHAG